MPDDPGTITLLLDQVRAGDAAAMNRLVDHLCQEMRTKADAMMFRERASHTLQATALIHEAYLRCFHEGTFDRAPNRRFLYKAFHRAMRQVLIEYSRRVKAEKRGGEARRQPFDAILERATRRTGYEDIAALESELQVLEASDEQAARVVEFKVFQECTDDEIADRLDVSKSTVQRDWRFAKAFLRSRLGNEPAP